MFSHLPKLTEADLEFVWDVELPKLILRPGGVCSTEQWWQKLCQGLSEEYATAVVAAGNMVMDTLEDELGSRLSEEELEDIGWALGWSVGVAQLFMLILVSRSLETQKLEAKLL